MRKSLLNILHLGIKELFSLKYDPVMVFLIAYMFSFAIFEEAQNPVSSVVNAAIAIVDEDHSKLSRRIGNAFMGPHFQAAKPIKIDQIDAVMESGKYSFVIDIPHNFQADLLAGRKTVIQLNVDATAIVLAGNGSAYVQQIIQQEVADFLKQDISQQAVSIVARARFNPNLETQWFQGLMSLTNNITLLAILLTGAAFIREREHGTIEHLLVLPLRPIEIMLAKIWANGLIVILATSLSLLIIIQGALAIPINGSIALYLLATTVYLFSVTSLGIFLATLARSMPQFGLLVILVFVVMMLLSGGNTPLEGMPYELQVIMQFVPSTHFVSMAQAILFRDAGLSIIWPDLFFAALIGTVFFSIALFRFRDTVSTAQQ